MKQYGYRERMVDYRVTMSLAADMLAKGIISKEEYRKIDRIIAKKYGLSLGSICFREPLITQDFRGNISRTEGGDAGGTDG